LSIHRNILLPVLRNIFIQFIILVSFKKLQRDSYMNEKKEKKFTSRYNLNRSKQVLDAAKTVGAGLTGIAVGGAIAGSGIGLAVAATETLPYSSSQIILANMIMSSMSALALAFGVIGDDAAASILGAMVILGAGAALGPIGAGISGVVFGMVSAVELGMSGILMASYDVHKNITATTGKDINNINTNMVVASAATAALLTAGFFKLRSVRTETMQNDKYEGSVGLKYIT
jgi:hypothetical protein